MATLLQKLIAFFLLCLDLFIGLLLLALCSVITPFTLVKFFCPLVVSLWCLAPVSHIFCFTMMILVVVLLTMIMSYWAGSVIWPMSMGLAFGVLGCSFVVTGMANLAFGLVIMFVFNSMSLPFGSSPCFAVFWSWEVPLLLVILLSLGV